MKHKPKPKVHYLPITTGRVGLSQTTGRVEFAGDNRNGTGIAVWTARVKKWERPEWRPPKQPPPWPPWWGGKMDCFVRLLTDKDAWGL
jgi:hypothetical protein